MAIEEFNWPPIPKPDNLPLWPCEIMALKGNKIARSFFVVSLTCKSV